MISEKIQTALDRIRQTQSLVQSVKQASDLQTSQIATLTGKVSDLQSKLDAGGTIGPDDLGALSEISSDIDTVNAQLQSAILANTQAIGSGIAANSNTADGAANASGGASQGSGQASQDAGDESKPQPLAGTGAPSA